MGIFDTVIDEDGRRHQTKWHPVGSEGGISPAMNLYRVGDPVPAVDGAYRATPEGEGEETLLLVRGGRIVAVRPPGTEGAKVPDPIGEAIRLLQDLYNRDVLHVELSSEERRAYDERIRAVLDALGADHDGKA